MFPIESFKNSLLKLVDILQRQEIPFHLTGGITGIAYGEPRMTQDIDVVVENEATSAGLGQLIAELAKSDFLFSEQTVIDAVGNKGMFQLYDSAESLKLDIYPREIIEGELTRSQNVEIFESVFLPIASRMDAAISKLIWIKKGSHKSRRDLRQIFLRSTEDEQKATRKMASNLDLANLLNEVLNEDDEIKD